MKKSIIFRLFPVIILLIGINFIISASNLPTVEILGKKFYVYTAKKGETFFGIAREQKWNDVELQRLNPDVISPLKKGVKVYYPVDEAESKAIPTESMRSVTPTELTHVVKKGETVYSIAQLYKIPVENIYRLNPSSRNGISADEILILNEDAPTIAQKDNTDHDNGNAYFYKIKSGDSLKSVAEANNVSVASILEANPGLTRYTFRPGENILIPQEGEGKEFITTTVEQQHVESFRTHIVKSEETWSSIARKNNVELKQLKDVNPDIVKLQKNQVIVIPDIVNIEVEQTIVSEDDRENSNSGIDEIYNDVHGIADSPDKKKINIAIIAETPNARKDTEFIRGFMTGVRKFINDDYRIKVKVIDGGEPQNNIVSKLNEFDPTLIFTTTDKSIPKYLSEFAFENKTPVVNTFDVKSEEYTQNPYFIQLLTPPNYFNDIVATNVFNKYSDYQLILIGAEDSSDILASALKKLWNDSNILSVSMEGLESLDSSKLMKSSGKFLFYGYPVKKDEVEKILKTLGNLQEMNPASEIKILGRPNWIVYDESLRNELQNVNAIIPSRFYIDDSSLIAKKFYNEYKDLFDRTPVKSVPLYAGVGYDTATYFIPGMEQTSLDLNKLRPSLESLQNEFDLKRVSNWGGFINMPVYLVEFSPSGIIDKITVK